jgi:hypothetical protein
MSEGTTAGNVILVGIAQLGTILCEVSEPTSLRTTGLPLHSLYGINTVEIFLRLLPASVLELCDAGVCSTFDVFRKGATAALSYSYRLD